MAVRKQHSLPLERFFVFFSATFFFQASSVLAGFWPPGESAAPLGMCIVQPQLKDKCCACARLLMGEQV